MLSDLVYLLLFEQLAPHYDGALSLLPSSAIVSEFDPFSLTENNQGPSKKDGALEPVTQAQSLFAIDLKTATPLLSKDIFSKRSIASITKLITAMVVLDAHKLDEVVTVSKNAATQEGSNMNLRVGEKLTVESLLTGMIINSANDAAVAFAEFDSGTEAAFAVKMNKKAQQLGLKQSHFTNAKGFDEPSHYSSAFDTMIFARAAASYPEIRKIAQLKNDTIHSIDGNVTHNLVSTNLLLENEHYTILGLKTGTTPLAGESIVSLARLQNGQEVLVVILGSPDRFKETKVVLDWIEKSWSWNH